MLRALSLFIALSLSIVGSVVPFVLARQATGLNQTLLLLMMLGVTGAFIYGVGFRPQAKWLGRIIAPAMTWPVMLGSFGVMLLIR